MRAATVLALLMVAGSTLVQAGDAAPPLPTIGPAADFVLISQDREEVTLAALRGKVVVVSFIYTWCPDICPTLTDKLARVQDALGADFGTKVAFLSVTFDPERDTPEALKAYAEAFDVDFSGWSFLTGEIDAIRAMAGRYGVVALPAAEGAIDHNTLTTLVDRYGVMRVQYIGYRFDPDEFRADLLRLVNEP